MCWAMGFLTKKICVLTDSLPLTIQHFSKYLILLFHLDIHVLDQFLFDLLLLLLHLFSVHLEFFFPDWEDSLFLFELFVSYRQKQLTWLT